jgi:hypothetical protein
MRWDGKNLQSMSLPYANEVLLLLFHCNDFNGQRLLRRSAPRNDSPLGHCERSEAISV